MMRRNCDRLVWGIGDGVGRVSGAAKQKTLDDSVGFPCYFVLSARLLHNKQSLMIIIMSIVIIIDKASTCDEHSPISISDNQY